MRSAALAHPLVRFYVPLGSEYIIASCQLPIPNWRFPIWVLCYEHQIRRFHVRPSSYSRALTFPKNGNRQQAFGNGRNPKLGSEMSSDNRQSAIGSWH